MSTKIQHKIFRKCVTLTCFFVKAFGIWLYEIDHRNRTIKYNFARVIYSFCVSVFLFYGYFTVGRDFVYYVNKKLFVSFAFQSIFFLHTNIIFVSCISLHVNPFLEYDKRKLAYEKCKEIMGSLKFYRLQMLDIRKYLILFIIKTLVYDAFVYVSIWFSWRSVGADTSSSQVYMLAFLFLPLSILRCYTNLFYGGMLIFEAIFRQLNIRLTDIVVQAGLTHSENDESIEFYSSQKYCQISEEFDKLSIFHAKLTEATKAFNSIFSVQLILSFISLILLLILRCFYQYVAIVEVIMTSGGSGISRILLMCGTISFASYDLYATSDACDSLVTQANEAGIILHSAKLDSNIDVRLHRSIDIFSSQILSNKLKLNQCGMFDLNLQTVQAAVSTIVSYAIILIQFELSSQQNK